MCLHITQCPLLNAVPTQQIQATYMKFPATMAHDQHDNNDIVWLEFPNEINININQQQHDQQDVIDLTNLPDELDEYKNQCIEDLMKNDNKKMAKLLWPTLEYFNWTYRFPPSWELFDRIYLAPGIKHKRDGEEGITKFSGYDALMNWVRRKRPSYILDEYYFQYC
jgi:hypothetical protein